MKKSWTLSCFGVLGKRKNCNYKGNLKAKLEVVLVDTPPPPPPPSISQPAQKTKVKRLKKKIGTKKRNESSTKTESTTQV